MRAMEHVLENLWIFVGTDYLKFQGQLDFETRCNITMCSFQMPFPVIVLF